MHAVFGAPTVFSDPRRGPFQFGDIVRFDKHHIDIVHWPVQIFLLDQIFYGFAIFFKFLETPRFIEAVSAKMIFQCFTTNGAPNGVTARIP